MFPLHLPHQSLSKNTQLAQRHFITVCYNGKYMTITICKKKALQFPIHTDFGQSDLSTASLTRTTAAADQLLTLSMKAG